MILANFIKFIYRCQRVKVVITTTIQRSINNDDLWESLKPPLVVSSLPDHLWLKLWIPKLSPGTATVFPTHLHSQSKHICCLHLKSLFSHRSITRCRNRRRCFLSRIWFLHFFLLSVEWTFVDRQRLKMARVVVLVLLLFISLILGLPTDKKHTTSRVVKKQLSDEEHYHNGVHNKDFDHEAFLGSEDEADEFDFLSPEESKTRLSMIVDRIDVNHDGNVTETELKQWIFQSQRRYILEDVDRQWLAHVDNDESANTISWEQFRNKTYGFLADGSTNRQQDDMKTYLDMLKFEISTTFIFLPPTIFFADVMNDVGRRRIWMAITSWTKMNLFCFFTPKNRNRCTMLWWKKR